ncbi:trans-sulfuration enzyme family protein [Saccharopolyspora griseoalba]|uniref:Trans-sulfuration enzyme family protein n=1 Tax=Saccharopolyspora griseoalba TaxID=1431848 RepID=A0ABW2LN76_9PSEU
MSSTRSFDSTAVHAGREDLAKLGVHVPPLDFSSTNPVPDVESGGTSYESMANGGHPTDDGGFVYARLWNPTVARFESALAQLEGTAEAVAFSSGMAAMTAAVLAAKELSGGRHVVAVRPLYGGTDHLLASGLLDVEVSYCAAGEVSAAVREDTCLVVVETPANPTLQLVDIEAVVTAASGCPVLVDNTFATPVLQNPAQHGAAFVLHSATKYLGGHGDVVGGVVAADAARAEAIRRVRVVTGALLNPLAGYLLHRGLATLPLRIRAQQEAAKKVAAWAQTQPWVSRVFYPGDPEQDRAGLIGRQQRGPGAMLALQVAGGYERAVGIAGAVQLFTPAVSLGGVDSLIQHPAALTHRPVPAAARPGADLLRLSIGLEDPDDLIADLDAAARSALGPVKPSGAAGRPAAAARER